MNAHTPETNTTNRFHQYALNTNINTCQCLLPCFINWNKRSSKIAILQKLNSLKLCGKKIISVAMWTVKLWDCSMSLSNLGPVYFLELKLVLILQWEMSKYHFQKICWNPTITLLPLRQSSVWSGRCWCCPQPPSSSPRQVGRWS